MDKIWGSSGGLNWSNNLNLNKDISQDPCVYHRSQNSPSWSSNWLILLSFIFCKNNGDKKSQDPHFTTCIQLRILNHPSRKVINFIPLFSCGFHMTSSKHNYANYDQFLPNFGMACNTIQAVFELNLKSFGQIQPELWAKEVWVLCYRGNGPGNSFAHQHGCHIINVSIWHGEGMFLTTVLKRLGGESWNFVTFNINLWNIKESYFWFPRLSGVTITTSLSGNTGYFPKLSFHMFPYDKILQVFNS